MKKLDTKFLSYLLIFVIIGFLGGVVGELWLNSFLLPDPYLNFKSYDDLAKRLDDLLVKEGSRGDLSERDLFLENSLQSARMALVRIYQYKALAKNQSQSLLPGDFIAMGAILTGDGWLISADQSLRTGEDYWVMTADGRLYRTESVQTETATDITYLKIAAVNLPVSQLTFKSDLAAAQSVYYFDQDLGLRAAVLSDLSYGQVAGAADLWRSSDRFYKYLHLDREVSLGAVGGAVFTAKGKMLGLLFDKNGLVVPMDYCRNTIRNLGTALGEGPRLEINFYDLSEYHNPAQTMTRGAWLAGAQSISSASPAKNILQVNDVILKVEKEELTPQKSLPEILANYAGGTILNFTVWRAGKEETLAVKLK